MNAVDYTRKFRSVATVSWVGALVIVLGLAWLGTIPYNDYLPFTALLIGHSADIGLHEAQYGFVRILRRADEDFIRISPHCLQMQTMRGGS